MIQIIKQHKVTGEIVKVDAKTAWINTTSGTIPARIMAQIKAATEAASDYLVIGQEGTYQAPTYVMSAKDKELKDYCDSRTRLERAMHE